MLTKEEDLAPILASLHPTDTCFAMINDLEKEAHLENCKIKWILGCKKLIIPNFKLLETFDFNLDGALLRSLNPNDAKYIFDHYDYKAFTHLTV